MRSPRRLIAVCTAALFVPLLLPLATGRVFTKDDLGALHLPFRYLYREALRSGGSWLWTSAYHSGFYLHGEGEAGMTHPLHLLLYRFLPLGPALNLEIVATYVAMLAGTGALLLRLGLAAEAAWFGAMVFTFSGFNLFNLMHVNHIAAVAHMPWLLLAVHVLMTSGDRRHRALAFAGTALVVGSQLLVGNPQYVWLTGVAVAGMIACLLWTGSPPARVALVAGAGIAGLLVGAVQLLPTLDFARESTRAAWTLDDALAFSLSPLNLVQLWSPFAFRFRIHAPEAESQIVHEFIVYNGAFCTVALAWLVMRWRQQAHRGLAIALLGFAAICLVLAMGRYGAVYTWLAHLPGLRTLRAPSRHLVLVQLAMSGIAAIVFEDLAGMIRRGETMALRRLWPVALVVALSVVTSVAAGALADSSWAAAHGLSLSGILRAAPWSLIVVAMAALMAMGARGARWALPAVVVLVACDQGFWGYSYAYRWGPIQRIEDIAVDVPPAARAGELIAPSIPGGINNVAVLRGFRVMPGYTGLVASSALDATSPIAQRLAGVAWHQTGYDWSRVADTMPRARLVEEARTSADVKADVERVDVARVALVDRSVEGLAAATGGGGDPGSARVIDDTPGHIVVETVSPARRLLVLTERFHAGWRAAEDADARTPVRVYGDFLGCVVDAGRHRVALTFTPDSYRYGRRATVAGVALTVVAATLLWPMGALRERERDRRVRT